jgi:hypothetical protein
VRMKKRGAGFTSRPFRNPGLEEQNEFKAEAG